MTDQTFVGPDDVETLVFDWGTLKWQATPEVSGSERVSAGVVQLEPGKGHERHHHPDSDEVLHVIAGRGEQTVADETREIGPGETISVPAGVEHGTINTGWEPLKLLAVYAPPGPEAALKDLEGCEVVPRGEYPEGED